MRYIRSINEMLSNREILDCFDDLIDNKFDLDMDELNYISIRKLGGKFNIEDVKETLLFAIPYLEEHGVKLSYITIEYLDSWKYDRKYNVNKFNDLDSLFDNIKNDYEIIRVFLKYKFVA